MKHKDFIQLMLNYNMRFGRDYRDVDVWLKDLSSRLSTRAMARLIKVDRTTLTKMMKEIA